MLEKQKEHLSQLQKQSKIETTIVKAIYIILFIAFNLFELYIAYLVGKYTNRVYELGIILLSFLVNKSAFGKPLHFKKNSTCFLVSLIMWYVSCKLSISLNLSILSNVILGVFNGLITSYIAVYLYQDQKKLTSREKIIAKLDGNTTQDYIFEYCRINGYKQSMADTIDLFLNNTLEETSQILDVDIRTIQRRIKSFIET